MWHKKFPIWQKIPTFICPISHSMSHSAHAFRPLVILSRWMYQWYGMCGVKSEEYCHVLTLVGADSVAKGGLVFLLDLLSLQIQGFLNLHLRQMEVNFITDPNSNCVIGYFFTVTIKKETNPWFCNAHCHCRLSPLLSWPPLPMRVFFKSPQFL